MRILCVSFACGRQTCFGNVVVWCDWIRTNNREGRAPKGRGEIHQQELRGMAVDLSMDAYEASSRARGSRANRVGLA